MRHSFFSATLSWERLMGKFTIGIVVKKGKEIKMEWCEILYGEWKAAENLYRAGRALLVLLVFSLTAGWVCSADPAVTGWSEDYVKEEKKGGSPVLKGAEMPAENSAISTLTDEEESVPAVTEISVELPLSAGTVPTESRISEETGSGMIDFPTEKDPVLPVIPKETVPEQPQEPENPADIVEDPIGGDAGEGVSLVVDGFVVDESGMICGVADMSIVSDGCIFLPSDGCTGIAKGAFLNAPAGIMEVYIPSNITYISEGAFAGLDEAEWFEAEGAESYYTEEGVLFAENGTCLLSFPAARIGTYKVPPQVTRFAADAFTGSKLDTVDAMACVLTDTGNLPESVRLLQMEKKQ